MSEAFRRRNNIIKMKNNASSASSWANMLKNAINSNSSKELIGGEVYVCARFGNEWKGMKIHKN